MDPGNSARVQESLPAYLEADATCFSADPRKSPIGTSLHHHCLALISSGGAFEGVR
jgi:hypothetical protein